MATEREQLTARIFLRAALPVIKVMLEDDAKTARKFANVNAVVQFAAKDSEGDIGSYLKFTHGVFEVVHEIAGNPDITFQFSSVAKMNAMFAGKPVLPRIKGITKAGLLLKVNADRNELLVFDAETGRIETVKCLSLKMESAREKQGQVFPEIDRGKKTIRTFARDLSKTVTFTLSDEDLARPVGSWQMGDVVRIYYQEPGKAIRLMNVTKTRI